MQYCPNKYYCTCNRCIYDYNSLQFINTDYYGEHGSVIEFHPIQCCTCQPIPYCPHKKFKESVHPCTACKSSSSIKCFPENGRCTLVELRDQAVSECDISECDIPECDGPCKFYDKKRVRISSKKLICCISRDVVSVGRGRGGCSSTISWPSSGSDVGEELHCIKTQVSTSACCVNSKKFGKKKYKKKGDNVTKQVYCVPKITKYLSDKNDQTEKEYKSEMVQCQYEDCGYTEGCDHCYPPERELGIYCYECPDNGTYSGSCACCCTKQMTGTCPPNIQRIPLECLTIKNNSLNMSKKSVLNQATSNITKAQGCGCGIIIDVKPCNIQAARSCFQVNVSTCSFPSKSCTSVICGPNPGVPAETQITKSCSDENIQTSNYNMSRKLSCKCSNYTFQLCGIQVTRSCSDEEIQVSSRDFKRKLICKNKSCGPNAGKTCEVQVEKKCSDQIIQVSSSITPEKLTTGTKMSKNLSVKYGEVQVAQDLSNKNVRVSSHIFPKKESKICCTNSCKTCEIQAKNSCLDKNVKVSSIQVLNKETNHDNKNFNTCSIQVMKSCSDKNIRVPSSQFSNDFDTNSFNERIITVIKGCSVQNVKISCSELSKMESKICGTNSFKACDIQIIKSCSDKNTKVSSSEFSKKENKNCGTNNYITCGVQVMKNKDMNVAFDDFKRQKIENNKVSKLQNEKPFYCSKNNCNSRICGNIAKTCKTDIIIISSCKNCATMTVPQKNSFLIKDSINFENDNVLVEKNIGGNALHKNFKCPNYLNLHTMDSICNCDAQGKSKQMINSNNHNNIYSLEGNNGRSTIKIEPFDCNCSNFTYKQENNNSYKVEKMTGRETSVTNKNDLNRSKKNSRRNISLPAKNENFQEIPKRMLSASVLRESYNFKCPNFLRCKEGIRRKTSVSSAKKHPRLKSQISQEYNTGTKISTARKKDSRSNKSFIKESCDTPENKKKTQYFSKDEKKNKKSTSKYGYCKCACPKCNKIRSNANLYKNLNQIRTNNNNFNDGYPNFLQNQQRMYPLYYSFNANPDIHRNNTNSNCHCNMYLPKNTDNFNNQPQFFMQYENQKKIKSKSKSRKSSACSIKSIATSRNQINNDIVQKLKLKPCPTENRNYQKVKNHSSLKEFIKSKIHVNKNSNKHVKLSKNTCKDSIKYRKSFISKSVLETIQSEKESSPDISENKSIALNKTNDIEVLKLQSGDLKELSLEIIVKSSKKSLLNDVTNKTDKGEKLLIKPWKNKIFCTENSSSNSNTEEKESMKMPKILVQTANPLQSKISRASQGYSLCFENKSLMTNDEDIENSLHLVKNTQKSTVEKEALVSNILAPKMKVINSAQQTLESNSENIIEKPNFNKSKSSVWFCSSNNYDSTKEYGNVHLMPCLKIPEQNNECLCNKSVSYFGFDDYVPNPFRNNKEEEFMKHKLNNDIQERRSSHNYRLRKNKKSRRHSSQSTSISSKCDDKDLYQSHGRNSKKTKTDKGSTTILEKGTLTSKSPDRCMVQEKELKIKSAFYTNTNNEIGINNSKQSVSKYDFNKKLINTYKKSNSERILQQLDFISTESENKYSIESEKLTSNTDKVGSVKTESIEERCIQKEHSPKESKILEVKKGKTFKEQNLKKKTKSNRSKKTDRYSSRINSNYNKESKNEEFTATSSTKRSEESDLDLLIDSMGTPNDTVFSTIEINNEQSRTHSKGNTRYPTQLQKLKEEITDRKKSFSSQLNHEEQQPLINIPQQVDVNINLKLVKCKAKYSKINNSKVYSSSKLNDVISLQEKEEKRGDSCKDCRCGGGKKSFVKQLASLFGKGQNPCEKMSCMRMSESSIKNNNEEWKIKKEQRKKCCGDKYTTITSREKLFADLEKKPIKFIHPTEPTVRAEGNASCTPDSCLGNTIEARIEAKKISASPSVVEVYTALPLKTSGINVNRSSMLCKDKSNIKSVPTYEITKVKRITKEQPTNVAKQMEQREIKKKTKQQKHVNCTKSIQKIMKTLAKINQMESKEKSHNIETNKQIKQGHNTYSKSKEKEKKLECTTSEKKRSKKEKKKTEDDKYKGVHVVYVNTKTMPHGKSVFLRSNEFQVNYVFIGNMFEALKLVPRVLHCKKCMDISQLNMCAGDTNKNIRKQKLEYSIITLNNNHADDKMNKKDFLDIVKKFEVYKSKEIILERQRAIDLKQTIQLCKPQVSVYEKLFRFITWKMVLLLNKKKKTYRQYKGGQYFNTKGNLGPEREVVIGDVSVYSILSVTSLVISIYIVWCYYYYTHE